VNTPPLSGNSWDSRAHQRGLPSGLRGRSLHPRLRCRTLKFGTDRHRSASKQLKATIPSKPCGGMAEMPRLQVGGRVRADGTRCGGRCRALQVESFMRTPGTFACVLRLHQVDKAPHVARNQATKVWVERDSGARTVPTSGAGRTGQPTNANIR